MSAAERTAQILKVVDDNRIPIVEISRTTVDEYFAMMTGCSKNEDNSDVESSAVFPTDPVPQKEDGYASDDTQTYEDTEMVTWPIGDEGDESDDTLPCEAVSFSCEEDEQVAKEMTWAAERTAQILKVVDTKADRIAHTFTEMYNAHQETPKKKRGSPKGSSKTCGLSGETGHNKRTCPTCIDLYALD